MQPEPIATYRVQLSPDFGFEQAAALIPYLSELGISHFYCSPYLQAAAGSTHGYDVVDPSRVNEELGRSELHVRFCQALLSAGLGQMIDVVPNHMAIAGRQNPWWWDVLENGPAGRYASYFDVDWQASEERWPNKVLLPVLADHYGRILEAGQFALSYEEEAFILHYEDHIFPLDPSSLVELLSRAAESCGSDSLAFLAESHARLPRPTATAREAVKRRHRDKAVLQQFLARLFREEPETAEALQSEIINLNRDPDVLDSLIEQQNYRLALWRTASKDLGYRRFFDIKDLAGLRVEDPEVFRSTHSLPVDWVRKGWVQGLRIDHPDGLRDPAQYFGRLREACPDSWIIAEKILEENEAIPSDWPVDGTTGYDFLNLLGGLFIDPGGEEILTHFYGEFTGESASFNELARICKRLVLTELLGSELNRLASLFVDICERHRRHRDYTRYELREALCETAACFPVYRSYVSPSRSAARPEDEQFVEQAISTATRQRSDLDPELFRFLKDLLLLGVAGEQETELAMRFQQLTSPAMAKGLEDTAFYSFNRLVCLNEVGGNPDRFGTSLQSFHKTCTQAQAERPLSLLATSTHDTKRSEDVRARLSLLSEIPQEWARAVLRWSSHNQRYREGEVPDRNTEYLLYQTLVGAWPIGPERATSYMEKAVREAKLHTSWTTPNTVYEQGLRNFVGAVLQDQEFCAELEHFVRPLVAPGRLNSLSQTLIKLTAPGIPDIYQGTELWDLSLVDPDNRRPVDFAKRRTLLHRLVALSPEQIVAGMEQGLPKMWVIRQALHLRRRRPELFGLPGGYRALPVQGSMAEHVVAFIRGEGAISVAPRLLLGLQDNWAETELKLPPGVWHNILTGDESAGGTVPVQKVLGRFPVGLLERREEST